MLRTTILPAFCIIMLWLLANELGGIGSPPFIGKNHSFSRVIYNDSSYLWCSGSHCVADEICPLVVTHWVGL